MPAGRSSVVYHPLSSAAIKLYENSIELFNEKDLRVNERMNTVTKWLDEGRFLTDSVHRLITDVSSVLWLLGVKQRPSRSCCLVSLQGDYLLCEEVRIVSKLCGQWCHGEITLIKIFDCHKEDEKKVRWTLSPMVRKSKGAGNHLHFALFKLICWH